MINRILNLRDSNIRKKINDRLDSKSKLIVGVKASIIALVFTLPIHLIFINITIVMFLYKTLLLLVFLFLLIYSVMLTIAYIEDIYYDLLNRKGYIKNINIKKIRINGFIFNAIIGAVFSLILSTILYIIIILI